MSMLPPPQPSSSSKVLNTVNTLVRNGHPLWEILAPSRLLPNRVTTAPPAGPRLAPSDRNAAALRALLHDAKATLEGFSGRFGTLTTDVTAALKEILGVAKSSETSKKEHLTQIMSAIEQAQNSAKESMASKTDIDSMQAAFSKVTADIEQTQKLMQLQIQTISIQVHSILPIIPMIQELTNTIHSSQEHIISAFDHRFRQIEASITNDITNNARTSLSSSLSRPSASHIDLPPPPKAHLARSDNHIESQARQHATQDSEPRIQQTCHAQDLSLSLGSQTLLQNELATQTSDASTCVDAMSQGAPNQASTSQSFVTSTTLPALQPNILTLSRSVDALLHAPEPVVEPDQSHFELSSSLPSNSKAPPPTAHPLESSASAFLEVRRLDFASTTRSTILSRLESTDAIKSSSQLVARPQPTDSSSTRPFVGISSIASSTSATIRSDNLPRAAATPVPTKLAKKASALTPPVQLAGHKRPREELATHQSGDAPPSKKASGSSNGIGRSLRSLDCGDEEDELADYGPIPCDARYELPNVTPPVDLFEENLEGWD